MITGILLGDGLTRKNQWQTIKFRGRPLLDYPLEALADSKLDQVILVLGKDYHRILNGIKIPTNRVRIAMNRRFDRGLSSYLKTAMNLISPDTTAVLVARGDFPFLKASLIDRMIDFFKNDKSGILIPVHQEREGHPRIYDQRYFQFLLRIAGNDVGEAVAAKFHNDVNKMEVMNPGVTKDLSSIKELENIDSIEIDRLEKEAHASDSTVMTNAFQKLEAQIKAKTTEMPPGKSTTEIRDEELSFNTDSISDYLDVSTVPDVSSQSVSLDSDSVEKSLAIPGAAEKKSVSLEKVGTSSQSELSLKALNDLMSLGNKAPGKERTGDGSKKEIFRRIPEPTRADVQGTDRNRTEPRQHPRTQPGHPPA